jgi:hypothetical protein
MGTAFKPSFHGRRARNPSGWAEMKAVLAHLLCAVGRLNRLGLPLNQERPIPRIERSRMVKAALHRNHDGRVRCC